MLGSNAGIINYDADKNFLPTDVSEPSNLKLWSAIHEGVDPSFTSNSNAYDNVSGWKNLADNENTWVKLAANQGAEVFRNYHDFKGIRFTGESGGDAFKLQDAAGDPTAITLDQGSNGFTICFTATNEAMDSGSTLFGSLSTNDSAIIWQDTDIIRLIVEGEVFNFGPFSPSLNDEQFYSFMIVSETNGTAKLYINNGEAAGVTSQNYNFECSMLGGNNNTPKNVNPNFIKQIILYDYALTLADRNALYNNYISPLI